MKKPEPPIRNYQKYTKRIAELDIEQKVDDLIEDLLEHKNKGYEINSEENYNSGRYDFYIECIDYESVEEQYKKDVERYNEQKKLYEEYTLNKKKEQDRKLYEKLKRKFEGVK